MIYFKDIVSILGRSILLSIVGLLLIGLINQVDLIMSISSRSANIHFKVLMICLYLAPYLASILLPFATLIATIVFINKSRKENKIIALQNIGIGPKELKKPLYLVGLTVVIINYWLYFFISPGLYKQFKEIQFEMRNQSINDLIEPNVLKNYGKGISIYIQFKDEYNNLKGIFISDAREKNSIKSFLAKAGKISLNGIELVDGTYYEKSSKGAGFVEFKRYFLTLNLPQPGKNMADPYSMSTSQLYNYGYIENNSKVQSVIHQKIVWPLYSFLFIAVCFNLEWYISYKNYSRKSSKILLLVVICIIISAAHFLIQNLATHLPTLGLISMYLFPAVVLLFIGRIK